MEDFLGVIAIVVGLIVLNVIWSAIKRAIFGDDDSTAELTSFAVRARFVSADADDLDFDHLVVEAIGLIPTEYPVNVEFVTSILDATEEDAKPVLCMIEDLQEPETIAFQLKLAGPRLQPGSGFGEWTRIGAAPVDPLIPAQGGQRTLLVAVRVVNADLTPDIRLGFGESDDPAVIAFGAAEISHRFESGYEGAAAAMSEGGGLAVKMAVAVSFADGALDDSEGETIAAWIRKMLTGVPESRRDEIKDVCNAALVEAHRDAKAGNLSLSALTDRMNEIGDVTVKFQAIELCLDVMVADGTADETELEMVRQLAAAMDIDYDELSRMKDQRTVGLQGDLSQSASVEAVLDIDPAWPRNRVQQHLRSEFRKWNGRLNSLTDPTERENAQQRLDLIAEARKKYE